MKLHPNVVEKLIYLYENYGGHVNNAKLRAHLQNLDLSAYERKTGEQDVVLVLTEDMMKAIRK
ncbi:hypothetical protein EBU71_07080 [bacterium]|jgi:hypothetical protein|nr:hypothetical protein [Candidatus Elulimicrobium humile]